MIVRGLQKSYDGKLVLDIEQHEFTPNCIHVVIGANGCGKSTLAKIIAGIMKPDGGEVDFGAASVGFMPQRCYAFYGSLLHNVMMGARRDVEKEVSLERARQLMETLGLTSLQDKSAKRLSGGETARMSLARVLMGSYDYLVLDEPTAALDVKSTLAAEKLISEYRVVHRTGVILITHSIKQVRRLADNVVFMEGGKIVESGSSEEVLGHTRTTQLQTFLDFA